MKKFLDQVDGLTETGAFKYISAPASDNSALREDAETVTA